MPKLGASQEKAWLITFGEILNQIKTMSSVTFLLTKAPFLLSLFYTGFLPLGRRIMISTSCFLVYPLNNAWDASACRLQEGLLILLMQHLLESPASVQIDYFPWI